MEKSEIRNTLKCAGAFIAWVIGSGFATGQEILQFFGSFGYKSFALVAINLVGFILLGKIILTKGFENKDAAGFDRYTLYCGKALGRIYSIMIPITLVLIISVLVSASGAALNQYYGLNRYIGSCVMAVLILLT